MQKLVRTINIGLGSTGAEVARYMVGKGVEIIVAVEVNPELVGQRLSDYLQKDAGEIVITDNLDEALKLDGDLAVICTSSPLEAIAPIAKKCLAAGYNVLTIAEKAFSPSYHKNQELVRELNELALANNVTMYATGVQDVLWVQMAYTLSAVCDEIKEIHGVNYALIDGFGKDCLEEASVGKKMDAYVPGEGGQLNDDFNYALYAIAEILDLKVISETTKVEPLAAKTDVYSEEADVHVNKGDVIGVSTHTVMETENGVILSADFYEKLTEEGESGKNEWSITGVPNVTLKMDEMYGEITTCVTAVNRIPDVINAKPGYVRPADMPALHFRSKKFGEYI